MSERQSLPPAVTTMNGDGASPYVLLGEHASRFIPAQYRGLGLPDSELVRHIAWDIGIGVLGQALSKHLDAPFLAAGYSRLLVDCNRPLRAPSSILEVSETTRIPGNLALSAAERRQRADRYYWPFQHAVGALLDRRRSSGQPTLVFGIHSFTPVFKGFVRPWHAGVLFRRSRRFGEALVEALRAPGLVVEANEPYTITDDGDYTVPVHGESRGLDAVLIEVRQDLIAQEAGALAWADRLAVVMRRLEPSIIETQSEPVSAALTSRRV